MTVNELAGVFSFFLASFIILVSCGGGSTIEDLSIVVEKENVLTATERREGWQLLFDGLSTKGWRGYNQATFPDKDWEVRDGSLIVLGSGLEESSFGGDIVTEKEFDHFELSLEFKISPQANSGIFYLIQETPGEPTWHNAPEFQVLDDSTYLKMGSMDMRKHLTGDNYDLHASCVLASKPLGEWNHARIIVDNRRVEHWLNNQKTVEYELGSPEWEELVDQSKFSQYPAYGRARKGPIGLQDHGHEVWYRNLKVRLLRR